ncbi:hypothetical protein J4526_08650 [Desulfurococcaceae archaeon MEX13E-LK6-19]|nr:hypothetical protein J4526_08650 [Desulfurococcaceae archaeon MEX13E-LK6-19]
MGIREKVPLNELVFRNYDKVTTHEFKKYMFNVMAKIRHASIERILEAKYFEARKRIRVERKYVDRDLFNVRAYILPWNVEYRTPEGIPIKTKLVMNSAIFHKGGGKFGIFLRLLSLGGFMLGCRLSRTFIGYTEIDYEDLVGEVKVKAKPVLYPILSAECIEDPRVDPLNPHDLYHVRGYYLFYRVHGMDVAVLMFRAKLNESMEPYEVEPIHFTLDDDIVIIRDFRDSFPLSPKTMVLRPWLTSINTGGVYVGYREETTVDFKSLEPIPELLPHGDEKKTGGNASVKIGSNEYLLIFHAVDIYGQYPQYAAVFSEDGELLGVTPEPVISPQPRLYHGARPGTIFVCGAALYKDKLLLSAGKDDEILVIYEADLQKILDAMKWVKG